MSERRPVASVDDKLAPIERSETKQAHEIERDLVFRSVVLSHLFDTIHSSLEDAEFTEEEVGAFMESLSAMTEEDQRAVLSVPFELRSRVYGLYRSRMERGEITVADIPQDLCQKNKELGFTTGYHLSNRQVPKIRAQSGVVWKIDGTEFDDRDEMRMAYYSEDYLSRYKKKSAKYLYVVRAEVGPNSAHKRDTSNRWGRATNLSIVDEYDMQKLEQEMDQEIQKQHEKKDATPQGVAS